jgi:hypothetical protein
MAAYAPFAGHDYDVQQTRDLLRQAGEILRTQLQLHGRESEFFACRQRLDVQFARERKRRLSGNSDDDIAQFVG